MQAFEGKGSFAELLAADPQVKERLDDGVLERCFEATHVLRHVGSIIDRALAAP
jgi:hypothetical protein